MMLYYISRESNLVVLRFPRKILYLLNDFEFVYIFNGYGLWTIFMFTSITVTVSHDSQIKLRAYKHANIC